MSNARTQVAKPFDYVSFQRELDRLTMITLEDLERLCDEPERNQSGKEVEAVIKQHASGYIVMAYDRPLTYTVVNDNGAPLLFRSIEQAIDRLSDVPYLLPTIKIDATDWRLVH